MNKRKLKEFKNNLKELLNKGIGFELKYQINDYYEENISIIEINIDINGNDYPDGWDEDIEDAVSEIVCEWGGKFYWESWTLYISFSDN